MNESASPVESRTGRARMKLGVSGIVVGNLTSKGAGAIREILFANWFGTGDIAAAFRVGQTGFVLPSNALIGDSLSAGLLPLYRRMSGEDRETARVLLLVVSLYALIFSVVVTSLLYFFAGKIAAFIAPGASPHTLELAATMLKIMALATPFHVLGQTLGYVETVYGRYGAISWRPLLLNLGSIGGAALAVWLSADYWIANGILISYIVFFAWTLWELARLDRIWPETRPSLSALQAVSGRFLRNILPLLGLPLAAQSSVLVERIVSSWMGNAVIPSVDYARFISDTLTQLIALPLGILTMSTHGGKAAREMRDHIGQIVRSISLATFPTAVFVGVNAEAIVRLLFARGAFNETSVRLTTDILRWSGTALGFTVTGYYMIKALNAQLRNREALSCTLLAVGANIALNLVMWRWLGPQTLGVSVFAYAVVTASLSFRALNLWSDTQSMLPWLAAGLGFQFVIEWGMLRCFGSSSPVGLGLSAGINAALWMTGIIFIPSLKEAARPVFSKFPGLRMLIR